MLVRLEIGFDTPELLLVLGGLFGVFVGIAFSALMFLTKRQIRTFLSYGVLVSFSGGGFIASTILESGPVLESAGSTQIVFDMLRAVFFAIVLVGGTVLLLKFSQWLYVLFFCQFLMGMYNVSLPTHAIPVWMISFEIMFSLILGLAGVFLFRPERRSLFDD